MKIFEHEPKLLSNSLTDIFFSLFLQHSPTDPSGDASVKAPERPNIGAGVPNQPISTDQPSNQETKPKKKKKKKAKAGDGEEDEGGKNAARGGGAAEEDLKSEFPRTGSDAGEQVTVTGTVEGSSPSLEEKKKRKKKPKEKAEGKEPKTPKTPKMGKTPKDPKEKKAKSSTPKTKTPKKTG